MNGSARSPRSGRNSAAEKPVLTKRWPAELFFLAALAARAADPVLSPELRTLPGVEAPTPWLRYRHPTATNVVVAGSWDRWIQRHPLHREQDLWALDVRPLGLRFGRYEYKFIVNGEWEPGENRYFYANEEGLLEKPPAILQRACLEDSHRLAVYFTQPISPERPLRVWLEPEVPVRSWHLATPDEDAPRLGYALADGSITFCLDEKVYGVDLPPSARVLVAGNFSGWDADGGAGRWSLQDPENDDLWTLTVPWSALRLPAGEKEVLFKFVVEHPFGPSRRWLSPPPQAPNAAPDGRGNVNLRVDPSRTGSTVLWITTGEPLALNETYVVVVAGLGERPIRAIVNPFPAADRLYSEKPLGVTLDRVQGTSTYRLFAPRAKAVHVCFFDTPAHTVFEPEFRRLEPSERYPLWRDPSDGVWEISLLGVDTGRYYAFQVQGPEGGEGEGFDPEAYWGDPYARAAAHAEQNTIVVDAEAPSPWFSGWSDQDYKPPRPEDVVIYEAHVRDLTAHPSSGVAPPLRGKYEGILATEGTGTGLDHLKELGVNMIEFLPLAEFNNGPDAYNWGYSPVFYFAPEASYARVPLQGSQYYELKRLINELHRRGFGVILDVVFNHVGSPNVFHGIDKKYFFRLNPDWTYSNFSGCGNDVRTEAPMMRRLIVDNIVYWMTEFRVDGFRFDLAELIDLETMRAVRDAARAINPNVLLISEPWSFRGENKHELTGTGWSAWNNDFRYAAKDFVMGRRNRDWLRRQIAGSLDTWAADPRQPVNYLESHDDMALADELCTRPDRDGRHLEDLAVDANRLAATILFTSLGIPMLAEGQEFLRSKRGLANTFALGDEVNALRWTDRDRPLAAEALAYYRGLIRLRLSPEGAAFRLHERPPPDYYRWILPPSEQALGYVVNAGRARPGASFVVLLNAGAEPVDFSVNFPPGTWRQIGDGRRLYAEGLPDTEPFSGGSERTIRVPALHSALFRDGF